MNDYINYSLPTSSDYWTNESDNVPSEFFDRAISELTSYVNDNWLGVDFEVNLVPETMSYNNRSRTSFEDDEEENILATIDNWMSNLWPDWLAECYN